MITICSEEVLKLQLFTDGSLFQNLHLNKYGKRFVNKHFSMETTERFFAVMSNEGGNLKFETMKDYLSKIQFDRVERQINKASNFLIILSNKSVLKNHNVKALIWTYLCKLKNKKKTK
ncbi:hypothetical protein LOAG_04324 [Loa loa]|uniref:Uncharacterized protein n=1 Tax=Loa loa TaxID=7209 RepID=A0A1S0U425_LOALO|nr:hypothetical protein LOAG_04324 [Loa loa]EFO24161.1 hypothetical protein LOAG_04324 [Loa loa]